MIIHGDNIIFNTSTSAIFGAKSGTLDVQADTIEIASPTQGSWREFIVGRKEWSLSVNHLVGIDATQQAVSVSSSGIVTINSIRKSNLCYILTNDNGTMVWQEFVTMTEQGRQAFCNLLDTIAYRTVVVVSKDMASTALTLELNSRFSGVQVGVNNIIVGVPYTTTTLVKVGDNIAYTEFRDANGLPTQSGIPSAIQMVGQSFTIYITLRDTNERISCTGICTSWKLTATKGNLAQGGFTFKGTGGFTSPAQQLSRDKIDQ